MNRAVSLDRAPAAMPEPRISRSEARASALEKRWGWAAFAGAPASVAEAERRPGPASNKRMKSYRLREFGAPLEHHERPTPEPEGDEVLVRVRAAGMCHSDLHIWEGDYDLGQGKRLLVKDRGANGV